jgi:hypothetical protein
MAQPCGETCAHRRRGQAGSDGGRGKIQAGGWDAEKGAKTLSDRPKAMFGGKNGHFRQKYDSKGCFHGTARPFHGTAQSFHGTVESLQRTAQ